MTQLNIVVPRRVYSCKASRIETGYVRLQQLILFLLPLVALNSNIQMCNLAIRESCNLERVVLLDDTFAKGQQSRRRGVITAPITFGVNIHKNIYIAAQSRHFVTSSWLYTKSVEQTMLVKECLWGIGTKLQIKWNIVYKTSEARMAQNPRARRRPFNTSSS